MYGPAESNAIPSPFRPVVHVYYWYYYYLFWKRVPPVAEEMYDLKTQKPWSSLLTILTVWSFSLWGLLFWQPWVVVVVFMFRHNHKFVQKPLRNCESLWNVRLVDNKFVSLLFLRFLIGFPWLCFIIFQHFLDLSKLQIKTIT